MKNLDVFCKLKSSVSNIFTQMYNFVLSLYKLLTSLEIETSLFFNFVVKISTMLRKLHFGHDSGF